MKTCFECGKKADIEHHVIPRSLGGKKTVPLCNQCHSLVHDAKLISLGSLIKEGRAKLQELKNKEKIIEMFMKGEQISKISKSTKVSRNSVYNVLEELSLIHI